MEENQNTENEKKKVKKNNEKKKNDFFAAHKGEFKKIVWPSRKELGKQTVTVVIVSLIVGAIIFAYDSAISFTYKKSINMVKGSKSSETMPLEATEITSGAMEEIGSELFTIGNTEAATQAEADVTTTNAQ